MGAWGAGLYDDDTAGDLKNTIALVAKVPEDGDRLLQMLKDVQGNVDPADEDGSLFWLVVADQFEKKGIHCRDASETALAIIESERDLAHCRARGADEKFLRERARSLGELAERLRSPRPAKARPKAAKPPSLVLETGQVHAFPTMQGNAWHPYRLPAHGSFVPDGWGALAVLDTGRAFDWLPWVALAGLMVPPDTKPTLDAALDARLIFHPQTRGAGRFVPKPAHAKGLALELLGHVDLDASRVTPHLSKWPVKRAIQFDWTIAYGALTSASKPSDTSSGLRLRSLCL